MNWDGPPWSTCDWGDCDERAITWRFDWTSGELPVCWAHKYADNNYSVKLDGDSI